MNFPRMKSLPRVVAARINSGKGIFGSFIDPEWVLHYIAAGSWTFLLENAWHTVKAGDMVLLPPRLLHVVHSLGGEPLIQYVVHFELVEQMPTGAFSRISVLPIGRRRQARELFHQLAREFASGEPFGEIVIGGMVAAMLGLHFRHAESKVGTHEALQGWHHVEAVIACLHRCHQESDLSLTRVAAAVELSPNYLCRIFRECTGHSIMDYLRQLRLQRAGELLVNSRLNCTQIAEAVGYEGIHLFSRHFSQYRRLSPTAFRRRHLLSSVPDRR